MTCPSCNSSSIKCNGHILECGRQFQKRVYLHLLEETKFHIIEMETCLSKDDHAAENMTDHAKIWFQDNDFPNAKLIGFSNPPQPASKSQLLEAMAQLKTAINQIGEAVSTSNHTGKTQHPGLMQRNGFNMPKCIVGITCGKKRGSMLFYKCIIRCNVFYSILMLITSLFSRCMPHSTPFW